MIRNHQSWLYRILPAAAHSSFKPYATSEPGTCGLAPVSPDVKLHQVSNQLRWDPFDISEDADWAHGLKPVGGAGSPVTKTGIGIFIFAAVLQHGVLDIQTELGRLLVRPNEIVVLPRGIRYRITLPKGPVRGYVSELYQCHFTLPELGPIGSNCLANPRDFQAPPASFDEDTSSEWTIVNKFNGALFAAQQHHTPFDVVARHGLYYPFKYDLGRFSVIGSISFDHPDPSIYTDLTAPSERPGTAVADFVIFPPRWLVQEDTFRPPWYHQNTMPEFMGLIRGDYDAKAGGGFRLAGASLHNVMPAHGPDAETFEKASNADLKPAKVGEGGMAFMFESSLMIGVTDWGLAKCKKCRRIIASTVGRR